MAVFVSGFVSALTRGVLRGSNYDVGTQEYTNDGMATGVAFFVFSTVLIGLLYLLQRSLSRDLWWLPYLVAVITCVFSTPFLFVIFFW